MITIEAPQTSSNFKLSQSGLTRFLSRVRDAVGVDGEIDVLLAGDTTLRRLNRTYRGKNKPTDVLSFPAAEMNGGGPQPCAGDLAISLDTAARQAAEYGHTLSDEVRTLLLHGTLHLAGYDHETDSGEMAAREAELRNQLRLPSSLIARTESSSKTPPSRKRAASKRAAKPPTNPAPGPSAKSRRAR